MAIVCPDASYDHIFGTEVFLETDTVDSECIIIIIIIIIITLCERQTRSPKAIEHTHVRLQPEPGALCTGLQQFMMAYPKPEGHRAYTCPSTTEPGPMHGLAASSTRKCTLAT
jgi:hypothetical protein